ncbi:RHS repeat-associated core domain protein [compost metagenome]
MGRVIAFFLALLLLGSTQAATLVFTTYYHNDHLGSPVAATDERNELLWRAHYRPFGERQENPREIPHGSPGYTGHVQDSTSGLVYMQARYYDPQLGRFLSMDPAGPNDAVPGSFNRYAYGLNNPYRYVDPDGRAPLALLLLAPEIEGALVYGGAAILGTVGGAYLAEEVIQAGVDKDKTGNESAPPVPGAEKQPGKTRGPSEIWTKPGGKDESNKDFDTLNPSDITEIKGGGRTGTLPDGRRVIVRRESSDGRPTLEIQEGRSRIKVRYN